MKNGKRILSVKVASIPDDDPDTSYLDQEEFEGRRAEYRNGDFSFVGIRARAEVQMTLHGTIQTVVSGGLWGIETDSDKSYLDSTAQEELADLRSTLAQMGFSRRAIASACKGVSL